MHHTIKRCCEIKASVVAKDERESGLRRILNYGHTIGHAVEALTDYSQFKHGEAIAIGMVYAAKLSCQLGHCSQETVESIESLVKQYGLPSRLPEFSVDEYIQTMYRDKKAHDRNIRFILVKDIGRVEIVDRVAESDIQKALSS